MDYRKLSEESLDIIMEKIRTANSETSSQTAELQTTHSKLNKHKIDDLYLNKLEKCIERMSVGESIGLNPSPMHAKKGFKRFISKFIEKTYLRISELSNRDLRIFCEETTKALVLARKEMKLLSTKADLQQDQIESLIRDNALLQESLKKHMSNK